MPIVARAVLVTLVAAAAALLALPRPADAAGVAVLKSRDNPQFNQTLEGFKARFGTRAPITEISLDGAVEAEVVARVSTLAPAAILAIGPAAASVAHTALAGTPLVYVAVPNPEALGLRGANVTGVSMMVQPRRCLALLKALSAKIARVGVIYSPERSQAYIDEAEKAASATGIALVAKKAAGEQDVAGALRDITGRIDALWLIPDSAIVSRNTFKFMLQTTSEASLPMLVFSLELLKSGALLSLSPDSADAGDKAALLVEKIVSGSKAEAVPVAYPNGRLELNDAVAARMGIALPAEIVGRKGAVY